MPKNSTIELSDEDKAFIIETAILFDAFDGVAAPAQDPLVREVNRRLLAMGPIAGPWSEAMFEFLKTDECKAARARGTLRQLLRCNRCHRLMEGTTAYDGACSCGGLIEAY